ncbi:hypothetical protein LZ198_29310 [Myxococcus sp. K15C18031901]|uniref:hypothetical protein n=1 Tax=Myxococcus dinghuensis TaxID=2906761 RepID=UPI0020A7D6EE|nr:hypothetical protein [Myxococcus dinghuensis]MCP3102985.1 hypothetical protein [Myxococcus dinghuensis]
MKPLPVNGAFVWGDDAPWDGPIAEALLSRVEFERRWGPPHASDLEGKGLGPEEFWGWRAPCGFQFFVRYLRDEDTFSIFAAVDELDHALAHLDWWRGEVRWRLDEHMPRRKLGWAVYRQDDTGNRHDVCVMASRPHAECFARLMEARAHKQWYGVELRGAPPFRPPRPRDGWFVIRQDEHGNRAEVAVIANERRARELAAALEAEPRHKQAYFVEPAETKG